MAIEEPVDQQAKKGIDVLAKVIDHDLLEVLGLTYNRGEEEYV